MQALPLPPLSCKTCNFFSKCFGARGIALAGERPAASAEGIVSFPLAVDGLVTRVLRGGKGQQPIVFLHGAGGNAGRWRHNVGQLASSRYGTYAIDLPGHGFAGDPLGGLDIDRMVEFVGATLKALHNAPAVLIGSGLGAQLATRLAIAAPHQVDKLVLSAPTGVAPLGLDRLERLARLSFYRTREGARERLRRMVYNPLSVTPELVEEDFRLNTGLTGGTARLAAIRDFVLATGDIAPSVLPQQPTLFVWGREDTFVPIGTMQATLKTIPHARHAVIADTAHLPFYERPGLFNRVVAAFLAGNLDSERIDDTTIT